MVDMKCQLPGVSKMYSSNFKFSSTFWSQANCLTSDLNHGLDDLDHRFELEKLTFLQEVQNFQKNYW